MVAQSLLDQPMNSSFHAHTKARATGRSDDRGRAGCLPGEARQGRRDARDRAGDQSASGPGSCGALDIQPPRRKEVWMAAASRRDVENGQGVEEAGVLKSQLEGGSAKSIPCGHSNTLQEVVGK